MSGSHEASTSSPANRPRSVSAGFAVARILVAVVLVAIAAVLIVEGVLIGQIGPDYSKPFAGRVTEVSRGQPDSTVGFEYVTLDGQDHAGRCQVPTAAVDEWTPGQTIEVYRRIGLFGTYACAREGLAGLMPAGTRSIYIGLGFGAASLALIAWLLVDLARYTRTLDPAARTSSRFSSPT